MREAIKRTLALIAFALCLAAAAQAQNHPVASQAVRALRGAQQRAAQESRQVQAYADAAQAEADAATHALKDAE